VAGRGKKKKKAARPYGAGGPGVAVETSIGECRPGKQGSPGKTRFSVTSSLKPCARMTRRRPIPGENVTWRNVRSTGWARQRIRGKSGRWANQKLGGNTAVRVVGPRDKSGLRGGGKVETKSENCVSKIKEIRATNKNEKGLRVGGWIALFIDI